MMSITILLGNSLGNSLENIWMSSLYEILVVGGTLWETPWCFSRSLATLQRSINTLHQNLHEHNCFSTTKNQVKH